MLVIFLPSSVQEAMTAPSSQIFYLFILSVFSSAVAYVSWSKAILLAEETASVSNYMF